MSVEGPEANALAHLEWARKAYDERKAENQTAALLARILGELQQSQGAARGHREQAVTYGESLAFAALLVMGAGQLSARRSAARSKNDDHPSSACLYYSADMRPRCWKSISVRPSPRSMRRTVISSSASSRLIGEGGHSRSG